jgi:hypothetical protein
MFKSKRLIALVAIVSAMGVSGFFIYLDWYNNQEQRNIEQFMQERFGKPDAKKQFWGEYLYNDESDEKPIYLGSTICASNLNNKELKVVLLVVCDKMIEEPDIFNNIFQHSTTEVHVFSINRSDRQFEVLAKEVVELPAGNDGAPRGLEVLKLGADFWGIKSEDFSMGQGIMLSAATIHVPYKSGFKKALTIITQHDNTGSVAPDEHDDDSNPTINFAQKLDVIDGGAEKTYKLRIKQEITKQNKTIKKTYTIDFNKKQWAYHYNKKHEEILGL